MDRLNTAQHSSIRIGDLYESMGFIVEQLDISDDPLQEAQDWLEISEKLWRESFVLVSSLREIVRELKEDI